jgi:hypothetical protein
MNAVKPPVSSESDNRVEVVHALLDGLAGADIMVAVVRFWACWCGEHPPLLRRALQAADAAADIVIQNFRAATGDGVKARVAKARQRIAATSPNFSNVDDFRGRSMAPDFNRCLMPRSRSSYHSLPDPGAGRLAWMVPPR